MTVFRFTSRDFDDFVNRHFLPFVQRARLPLQRLHDDAYQVSGKEFVMRIRRGRGHHVDFLVTIVPEELASNDLDSLENEIGLGLVAEFNGAPLVHNVMDTPQKMEQAFEEAVASAERFLLPYLLGQKESLAELRRYIAEKVERVGLKNINLCFPKNVRPEW